MIRPHIRTDIARLQASKVLRSLGQGALLVTFALYLDELGWSATAIGGLLSLGALYRRSVCPSAC